MRPVQGDAPSLAAGIPRLYAAASLKHGDVRHRVRDVEEYSAALCRGLIEALSLDRSRNNHVGGIPRLYAAASLKHHVRLSRRPDLGVVFRGFMPRPH